MQKEYSISVILTIMLSLINSEAIAHGAGSGAGGAGFGAGHYGGGTFYGGGGGHYGGGMYYGSRGNSNAESGHYTPSGEYHAQRYYYEPIEERPRTSGEQAHANQGQAGAHANQGQSGAHANQGQSTAHGNQGQSTVHTNQGHQLRQGNQGSAVHGNLTNIPSYNPNQFHNPNFNINYAQHPDQYHGYWAYQNGHPYYHGYWYDYWAGVPWLWWGGFYGFWLWDTALAQEVFVYEDKPGACRYWNGTSWNWWSEGPYGCPY